MPSVSTKATAEAKDQATAAVPTVEAAAKFLADAEAGPAGRDEDALAYFREIGEFRNFTLCELPNSGIERGHARGACYGFTVMRNLLFCAWQAQAWELTAACQTSEAAPGYGPRPRNTS